jgi:hypothetical protein
MHGNPRPITLTLSDQHIEQMIKHHDLTEGGWFKPM